MVTREDDELLARLTRDEGYRMHPYRCSAGKLTIGIGRNIEDVGISRPEAEVLLKNDVDMAIAHLTANYPEWYVLLSLERQRVCIEMVFQLGPRGFAGFRKMIAALAIMDYETAAAEMLDSKWATRDTPERAQRAASRMRSGNGDNLAV